MMKSHIRLLLLFLSLLASSLTAGAQERDSSAAPDTSVAQASPARPDTSGIQQKDSSTAITAEDRQTPVGGQTEITRHAPKITEIISLNKIFWIIITLFVTYFFSKLLNVILENLSERSSTYRLGIKRTIPVFRIVVWTTAIYVIIQGIISPPIESLVTLGASLGIAVGFASQDIIKNIFGGIIILIDRPFQVGDKVDIGGHYGEVIQIGLRSVRLVTPDDSMVSIPNGELINGTVTNANSGALDCQVVAEIFLPASVDLQKVKAIAYKAAVISRYVYLNKPIAVIVKNEIRDKDPIVKLRIKAYVLDIRYEFPFMSEMTELVLTEVNRRGLLKN